MRKRTFIFIAAVLGMAGCDSPKEAEMPLAAENTPEAVIAAEAPPYYDPDTDKWLRPVRDPYTLENFQQAYDNLRAAVSPFSASLPQNLPAKRLQATHYHVKLWPRSEAELEAFSTMEGVVTAPFPFDTHMLGNEESATLVKTASASAAPQRRYYEHPGIVITSDGDEFEAKPYLLPVIYAVWPRELPFPDGADYQVLYEVFLPEEGNAQTARTFAGASSDLLEREAVRLARGTSFLPDPIVLLSATLKSSVDSHLGATAPLAYLKVRVQDGSYTIDTYTNASGTFKLTKAVNLDAKVYGFLEYGDDWIIVNDKGTVWTWQIWTTAGALHGKTVGYGDFGVNIHRAASFWFKGNHELTRAVKPAGNRIKIHARPEETKYYGMFFSTADYPYIHIYYGERTNHSIITTTFHELGHASHYNTMSYSKYKNVDKMIKESWACFTGWYMSEKHYTDLGKIYISTKYGEHKQGWSVLISKERAYSPLFIDLRDDHNQRQKETELHFINYPDDRIKNVPVPIIEWIALNSSGTSTFQNNTGRYVGTYYSEHDLRLYLEYFLTNWEK